MKKGLAGGAMSLGLLALAYFGWTAIEQEDPVTDTSVIVDQVALSPTTDATTDATTETAATSAGQSAEVTPSENSTTAETTGQTNAETVTASDSTGISAAQAEAEAAEAAKAEAEAAEAARAEAEAAEAAKAEAEAAQAKAEEEAAAQAAAEAEAAKRLPRFDLVRIDADGQTVIAGKAAPGSRVEVLLDGEVIAEADADSAGAFISIVTTPLSGEAQQLQLRTALPRTEPEQQDVAASSTSSDSSASESATDGAETAAQAEQSVEEPVVAVAPAPAPPELTAPETEGDPAGPQTASQQAAVATNAETEASTETAALSDSQQAATDEPVPGLTSPPAQVEPSVEQEQSAPAAADQTEVARAQPAQPAPEPAEAPAAQQDPAYAVSAPVIILPSSSADQAPALVQPTEDRVALLQPQGKALSVTLDAISYGETGAVQLNGRGAPGNSVRIYGNGDRLGDTGVAENGTWAWALARERALGIRLFRFDELDQGGAVASRVETPFTYESLSPKVVRQREVVIQRGNNLWSIAEQYYGEGLQFSVIYGANSDLIRDPDLIYPGQVFSVPELVDAE